MPTVLLVLLIAAGVAGGKIFSETSAEYIAKFVVENEEFGLSTQAARTYEPGGLAADTPPLNGQTIAVLAASLATAESTAANSSVQMVDAPQAAATAAAAPVMTTAATDDAASAAKGAPSDTPDSVPGTTETAADSGFIDSAALLSVIGDTPHRQPDGAVFLPIASQRVFGLRSTLAERVEAPVTVELPGRIIVDPNTATVIQAHQRGIILPAGKRLPYDGQSVRSGDLLAYLRPVFSTLERLEIDERIQDLENQIDLQRKRLARLEEVMFVRFRESKMEQIRVEIAGMQRHLAVLRGKLTERVELRAASDGVISDIDITAGQYVEAGAELFDIVDPSRLWVTAFAFDAGLVDRISGADAITEDGTSLPLNLIGAGLSLQNQAIPLQFEIAQPTTRTTINKPVTVVVRTRDKTISGIKLPRSSISRTTDGRHVLWERRTAETFIQHHVQMVGLDGENVLVTSNLSPRMRVVADGAAILNQIR